MNSINRMKLKMFQAVQAFLLLFPTITVKLPNFTQFKTQLDDAINQILAIEEDLVNRSKGIADKKKQLHDSLVQLLQENSNKLQAYALFINDPILIAQSKYTATTIRTLSDQNLLSTAGSIYTTINEHLTALATYLLSAETQTAYKTAIDAFDDSLSLYRESQIDGKSSNKLENEAFDKGDNALDNIDALVDMVRFSEAAFYASYKNARKVIPQGTQSIQVQGKITDAANTEPIPGADIIFRLQGETQIVLQKETAEKGGFKVPSLDEGIYDVTIAKVGYKNHVQTLVIDWNQLCELNVALSRIS